MCKVLYMIKKFILKYCCPGLKSKYTLRRQLIESYGFITFLSITLVVVFGIISVIHAGNLVKSESKYGLTYQVTTKLHTLNKHTAYVLTEKLLYYRKTSTLIKELVQDRIVGYNGSSNIVVLNDLDDSNNTTTTTTTTTATATRNDDHPFINDMYVPFYDVDSNTNVYPLRTSLSSLLEFKPHTTIDDFIESFGTKRATYFMLENNSQMNQEDQQDDQQQQDYYNDTSGSILPPNTVSMKSAMYTYPGSGDDSACDGDDTANCTAARITGEDEDEILSFLSSLSSIPSEAAAITTKTLGMKSADLSVYLKSFYESIPEASSISIQYHNSGIGSIVEIPSKKQRGGNKRIRQHYHANTNNNHHHEDIGCDWAYQEINPYTNLPYSTKEEIQWCNDNRRRISSRHNETNSSNNSSNSSAYYDDYLFLNPMEHPMCKNQALNPNSSLIYGPYHDHTINEWVVSIGISVFDRM